MIRYNISLSDLEQRIDVCKPDWRNRAANRTTSFKAAKKYDETSGIWSEIKKVYVDLQHNKCAYCERPLEGLIELDVEHFRPKSSVKKWPPSTWPPESLGMPKALTYGFSTGDAWGEGYYLLAYCLTNYAMACKNCNSVLKSNYFPIAGNRGTQSDNPIDLKVEKPLLIYPIGEVDDAPEDLIKFDGIVPIPVHLTGYEYQRAKVTIDFFALTEREALRQQRAQGISWLGDWLQKLENATTDSDKIRAENMINEMTSARWFQVNCLRSFKKLFYENKSKALLILQEAQDYVSSYGHHGGPR